jgi:hypothetical protein
MKWFLFALIATCAGCAPTSIDSPDLTADALYPWGAQRWDLETRYAPGTFFWIVNEVPKDEFAAAVVREMVSLRKPRPVSYEIFLRRSADGENCRDYVFYNDQERVLYAARRTLEEPSR